MKQKMLKQMLCILLAVVMSVGVIPASAMAAEVEPIAEESVVEEEPAVEEPLVVEEVPAAVEEPMVEETPIVEEPPVVEEVPAAEESVIIEEVTEYQEAEAYQTPARTVIEQVELGCYYPVGGREADFKAWSLTKGARIYDEVDNYLYEYHGVRWYDLTVGEYLVEGDCWTTGHKYQVEIFVFVDNPIYYEFKTTTPDGYGQVSTILDVYNYINGEPARGASLTHSTPSSGYIAKYQFPECGDAPAPITEVGVNDLEQPIAGNKVDFDVTLASDNYKFSYGTESHYTKGLLWYDYTAGRYVQEGDCYQANHVYWLIIPIVTKQPYRFAVGDDGKTSVTVDNIADESYVINPYSPGNPKERLEIHYEFAACKEPISAIAIEGITAPVEGKTPDYYAKVIESDREKYYIPGKNFGRDTIVWYEDGSKVMTSTDKFHDGHRYSVAIEVYAKDKNLFAVDEELETKVTGTLDGETAVIRKAWEQAAKEAVELYYDFGICPERLIDQVVRVFR